MQKKIISLMIAAGIVLPSVSNAIEVADKQLEVYGKLHMSIDSSTPDVTGESTQTSISSNSSRLGFKGELAFENGMTGIYKLEQEVNYDEANGSFATRNSYAGLKGGFGTVLLGHHDTPVKNVGGKWDLFGDTVADRRAVLGAATGKGNKLNDRGENAVMYKNRFGSVKPEAMYSASNPTASVSGSLDDNNADMTSVALFYNQGSLLTAVGVENWSDQGGEEVDNLRVSVVYKFSNARIGIIAEDTDSNVSGSVWKRTVTGLNGSMKLGGGMDVRLQYLNAGDHDVSSDSGATMTAIGLFNKLDKKAQVYAVYTSTDNGANAKFQGVDGGHGDELKTTNGGNPSALSLGYVLKF